MAKGDVLKNLRPSNDKKFMGHTENERVTASNSDAERLKELRILLENIEDPGDASNIKGEIFQIEQSMRS